MSLSASIVIKNVGFMRRWLLAVTLRTTCGLLVLRHLIPKEPSNCSGQPKIGENVRTPGEFRAGLLPINWSSFAQFVWHGSLVGGALGC